MTLQDAIEISKTLPAVSTFNETLHEDYLDGLLTDQDLINYTVILNNR